MELNNLIIRKAKKSDLPEVKEITRLAYEVPYKKNGMFTPSIESEDLIEKFGKNNFFIMVAEYNNKIVGAIRYIFYKNNSLYFYKLAVLEEYRRRSIASSLIDEVEKIAKNKKCSSVLLECAEEKYLAEYYMKLGFEIDEIKPHENHHDVYMSKKIE